MKKLFLTLAMLFIASLSFAKSKEKIVYENGNQIITDFMNKGNIVKIINSTEINESTKICYINKTFITSIKFEPEEIEISTSGYNVMTGKNNESEDYSASYWILELDENFNLIIRKRN